MAALPPTPSAAATPAPARRPHAETRLLYRITKEVLAREQPLGALLDAVVQQLAEFGLPHATVRLSDPATGEVRLEASHGLSEAGHRANRPAEQLAREVLRAGQATVVASRDSPRAAFICVPIATLRGQVLGALSVESPAEDADALQWERRLLSVVATLIAESVRQRRDEREEAESVGTTGGRAGPEPAGHPDIVGASHAMREVFLLIGQVAPFDTPVLLRGESGTGKELVAKAIHDASARAAAPFVSVNCGALPEQLVESELFGHVRGAYTGASATRRGRFELADGGTLFLDEVGELPAAMQVKLLRALQSGEIHPVGAESARRVDVRVVAATNANLEKAMAEGRFREDLYYRLNVFPIFLPALRERKTDITLLADHFVEKYARAHRKPVVRISTPAIELMTAYHWPGNVRELENCIARAVLLTQDGVIRAHHLPPTLQTGDSSGTTQAGSLQAMMDGFEREILIEAMKNAGGNMTRAAAALETTPRILAYRLRRHGLHDSLASLRRSAPASEP